MGTSGNRDCQRASRSALKDFTDDALTISAGSFEQLYSFCYWVMRLNKCRPSGLLAQEHSD